MFQLPQSGSQTRFQPISAIGDPSFSHSSRHDVLMACASDLAEPWAGFHTKQRRRGKAMHCIDISRKILKDTPTLSFAHYIMAISSHHLGDNTAMHRHILLSQRFGQFEGWLAERRFILFANLITAATEKNLTTDIATLLGTQPGTELLTKYFLARPELRPMIKATTNRASTGDQQRFLNLIRRRGSSL